MARLSRRGARKTGPATPPADAPKAAAAIVTGAGTNAGPTKAAPTGPGGLPLPSPLAGTNLVIADIVLRAAGGLLRNRMEKGLLVQSYGTDDTSKARAEQLVDGRGLATSLALWGASRLATRSPLGLAVVAGGLAAKVLYDRGKRLEAGRRAENRAEGET
jgi:hypothetical protein